MIKMYNVTFCNIGIWEYFDHTSGSNSIDIFYICPQKRFSPLKKLHFSWSSSTVYILLLPICLRPKFLICDSVLYIDQSFLQTTNSFHFLWICVLYFGFWPTVSTVAFFAFLSFIGFVLFIDIFILQICCKIILSSKSYFSFSFSLCASHFWWIVDSNISSIHFLSDNASSHACAAEPADVTDVGNIPLFSDIWTTRISTSPIFSISSSSFSSKYWRLNSSRHLIYSSEKFYLGTLFGLNGCIPPLTKPLWITSSLTFIDVSPKKNGILEVFV